MNRRRGARAADRAGLENRCLGNQTEGSNPSLSASRMTVIALPSLAWATKLDRISLSSWWFFCALSLSPIRGNRVLPGDGGRRPVLAYVQVIRPRKCTVEWRRSPRKRTYIGYKCRYEPRIRRIKGPLAARGGWRRASGAGIVCAASG